jgi:hypothetical protein
MFFSLYDKTVPYAERSIIISQNLKLIFLGTRDHTGLQSVELFKNIVEFHLSYSYLKMLANVLNVVRPFS